MKLYESNYSYRTRSNDLVGRINFLPSKPWYEVNIKINSGFIARHQLDLMPDIPSLSTCLMMISSRQMNILKDIIEDTSEGFAKRLFIEAKALEILHSSIQATEKSSTLSTSSILSKVLEAKSYIENHMDHSYSIADLSRIVGINESSLQKQFKQVFNQTIFEFSSSVKMNKAKELLLYTDKTVAEVSVLVGYKNPTHFTAAFKKVYACTPKVYRTRLPDSLGSRV